MSYTDEKLRTTILFYRLRDLADENVSLESSNYKKFVRENLLNIISSCAINGSAYEIADKYFNYIRYAELPEIKYLLAFFKKYKLISFEPFGYPDNIIFNYKEDLTQEDIIDAYSKELAYVNEKTKIEFEDKKISKPSIFERLDSFTTIEERQNHLHELTSKYSESLRLTKQENAYYNFIMDKENGLYKLLENALMNYDGRNFKLEYNSSIVKFSYILEFCNKYGIDIKMIERGDEINKDYLPGIKTLLDIKNLFVCFFAELQQIERFSKTKEELWEEHNEFVTNNKEWLEERKTSR